MNTHWSKKSQEEIKSIVFEALEQNVNYQKETIIGIPASFLDEKVFNQEGSYDLAPMNPENWMKSKDFFSILEDELNKLPQKPCLVLLVNIANQTY